MKQRLDPASIGVTFVDLLFALAVTQVFTPVADWAKDATKNPLPTSSSMQLAVALVITITSWIGYHASANKPRFQVHFINAEFLKFGLDVAMVAIYFLLAAFATRHPVTLRPQTSLVFLAFALYLAWDLVSAYEKRNTNDNEYVKEWDRVLENPQRTDVTTPWTPTDWGRIAATLMSLVAVGVLWLLVIVGHSRLTVHWIVFDDVLLIVVLFGYRFLKEGLAFYRGIEAEDQKRVRARRQLKALLKSLDDRKEINNPVPPEVDPDIVEV